MNREDMVIYWREAAEKAEARVIEQREELLRLKGRVLDLEEYLEGERGQRHKNYLEICRLQEELRKRGA